MRTEAEMLEVQRRFDALYNRPTRYEVLVYIPERSLTFALGYWHRTGKHELLSAVQGYGQILLDLSGITDVDKIAFTSARGIEVKAPDGALKLRAYRGRTERTAILEGELPAPGVQP